MKMRTLGNSNIEVSSVAMGCMTFMGGTVQSSIDVVDAAIDSGINFFDTAPMYGKGESEVRLGKALKGRREQNVIATKLNLQDLRSSDLVQSCERSLQLLDTDYIDLLQIHWPNWDVPLEESMGALETLKFAGKIREYGVCNFGKQDLSEALSYQQVATCQLPYNLLFRTLEYDVEPICAENNVGLLCYSPLADGLLTGKYASADDVPEGRARNRLFSKDRPKTKHDEVGCEEEVFAALQVIKSCSEELGQPMLRVALAWLIHQKQVTSVLAGARTAEQIQANAQAGSLELTEDMIQRLSLATDPVKRKLGKSLDLWLPQSRIR